MPAALIFAVTAAACGGGDENDGGRETTQATATTEATEEAVSFSEDEAKAAAQTAQLTIGDFPTGWVRRSPEPEESTFGPGLPAECQVFVEQEKFPGTVVELESDEFVSPDDETVSSSSTVYEDVEVGEAAFAAIRQFIDDCRQPLKDALTQVFRDTLKEQAEAENSTLQLNLTEFNFDLMSFPEYGDESMAFRMGGKIESSVVSFDFAIDFIGTRVGNVDTGITYEALGRSPNADFEQQLMSTLEQRATQAAASLK